MPFLSRFPSYHRVGGEKGKPAAFLLFPCARARSTFYGFIAIDKKGLQVSSQLLLLVAAGSHDFGQPFFILN